MFRRRRAADHPVKDGWALTALAEPGDDNVVRGPRPAHYVLAGVGTEVALTHFELPCAEGAVQGAEAAGEERSRRSPPGSGCPGSASRSPSSVAQRDKAERTARPLKRFENRTVPVGKLLGLTQHGWVRSAVLVGTSGDPPEQTLAGIELDPVTASELLGELSELTR